VARLALLAMVPAIKFSPGEIVMAHGADGHEMFLVVDGTAQEEDSKGSATQVPLLLLWMIGQLPDSSRCAISTRRRVPTCGWSWEQGSCWEHGRVVRIGRKDMTGDRPPSQPVSRASPASRSIPSINPSFCPLLYISCVISLTSR
jgi:hypothetical protein